YEGVSATVTFAAKHGSQDLADLEDDLQLVLLDDQGQKLSADLWSADKLAEGKTGTYNAKLVVGKAGTYQVSVYYRKGGGTALYAPIQGLKSAQLVVTADPNAKLHGSFTADKTGLSSVIIGDATDLHLKILSEAGSFVSGLADKLTLADLSDVKFEQDTGEYKAHFAAKGRQPGRYVLKPLYNNKAMAGADPLTITISQNLPEQSKITLSLAKPHLVVPEQNDELTISILDAKGKAVPGLGNQIELSAEPAGLVLGTVTDAKGTYKATIKAAKKPESYLITAHVAGRSASIKLAVLGEDPKHLQASFTRAPLGNIAVGQDVQLSFAISKDSKPYE
uniref:Invasin_D3 domain-containing protein n=1 Tax=Anopheles maculatus TaxID=74869 RepID=A0A182SDR1_9DIPT